MSHFFWKTVFISLFVTFFLVSSPQIESVRYGNQIRILSLSRVDSNQTSLKLAEKIRKKQQDEKEATIQRKIDEKAFKRNHILQEYLKQRGIITSVLKDFYSGRY